MSTIALVDTTLEILGESIGTVVSTHGTIAAAFSAFKPGAWRYPRLNNPNPQSGNTTDEVATRAILSSNVQNDGDTGSLESSIGSPAGRKMITSEKFK